MELRSDSWPLPKPDRIHHIVEDFLTDWTGIHSTFFQIGRIHCPLPNCK